MTSPRTFSLYALLGAVFVTAIFNSSCGGSYEDQQEAKASKFRERIKNRKAPALYRFVNLTPEAVHTEVDGKPFTSEVDPEKAGIFAPISPSSHEVKFFAGEKLIATQSVDLAPGEFRSSVVYGPAAHVAVATIAGEVVKPTSPGASVTFTSLSGHSGGAQATIGGTKVQLSGDLATSAEVQVQPGGQEFELFGVAGSKSTYSFSAGYTYSIFFWKDANKEKSIVITNAGAKPSFGAGSNAG